MYDLTPNQQHVYDTLKNLIEKNGNAVTLQMIKDELCEQDFEISSLNSVVQYLKSLEKKGYIHREKNKRGGIVLREIENNNEKTVQVPSHGFWEIPVLGMANCGSPVMFADEVFDGTVKVSKRLLPIKTKKGVFMVRVNGNSMNKRGLDEGDYAIIKHIDHCGDIKNNDVVLAIINGLATIKTYFKTVDSIILKPESTQKNYQPIFLHPEDEFYINGKLVGVFKNP